MIDRPTALQLALDAIDDVFKSEVSIRTRNAQVDRSIDLSKAYDDAMKARGLAISLAMTKFK